MGYEWAKNLQHINYGLVQGMSTRKGTVVFLDNILNETKETMHDVMKKNEKKYAQVENADKVADLVGIAAVMVQDMAAKRVNNYKFEWSRMTSFEGDTGPYLQYAHSRLCSMERNAQDNISEADMLNADFSLLKEKHAEELARVLAQFPDVLLQSLKNQEPSTVVTYLFKLTHIVSSCYDVLWVAGQEKQLAAARLALYSAARQVLGNGMRLLGLTPVERM
jgi:arginyl-tRNA synthetase